MKQRGTQRRTRFVLKAEVRDLRAEPRPAFLRALARHIDGHTQSRTSFVRPAFAVGLTGLLTAALVTSGALGYAGSSSATAFTAIKQAAKGSKDPTIVFGSAASKQYGGGACGSSKKPCRITIKDEKVREGNSGTTPMLFTVNLSGSPVTTVTVNYTTFDNTARSFSDYEPTGGTVVFEPGETTKFILVFVFGDVVPEPNETFFVDLFNPSPNAVIADGHAIGTIIDDD